MNTKLASVVNFVTVADSPYQDIARTIVLSRMHTMIKVSKYLLPAI